MMNYNIGDKVVCIKSYPGYRATIGKTYTVNGGYKDYLRLKEAPGTDWYIGWFVPLALYNSKLYQVLKDDT